MKFQLPVRSRSPQQVDLDSYFSGGRLTLHYPLTKQVVIFDEVAVRTYWPAPADFLLPHRAPIDALLSKGAQIAVGRQGEMTLATLTLGGDGGGRILEMTLDPSRDYRVVAWSEPAARTSGKVDWRLDRSTGDFVPVGALLSINTEMRTTTYTLTMNSFSFDTAEPAVAEFRFQPGMLVGDHSTPKTSDEPQAGPSVFRIGDDGKPQKVLMIDDEPVELSSTTRISVWTGALLASSLLLALRVRISK
ncbi:MAG: hypothetical protein HZB38_04780 [Planctomycetes bacterium]|nr:hypothetical protein [Planctomycetota bacterium]